MQTKDLIYGAPQVDVICYDNDIWHTWERDIFSFTFSWALYLEVASWGLGCEIAVTPKLPTDEET